MSISVVINTRNEEKNISTVLSSVKDLADEIIVVDMESTDNTVLIAKKFGAKVFNHRMIGYVEPARNFALSKASSEWILILDADEEVENPLIKKLISISKSKNSADYYRIPRKNIIFKKWIEHSNWWPDYNIRFFKKGFVVWNEVIHSVPTTQGKGLDLQANFTNAIVHHNYNSVSQYLERMNRYTDIQARMLAKNNRIFEWKDLFSKSLGEFLSRYFLYEGYKDGLHGLLLSFLQAFSEGIVYIKLWEIQKFKDEKIHPSEFICELNNSERQINYWLNFSKFKKGEFLKSALRKLLS